MSIPYFTRAILLTLLAALLLPSVSIPIAQAAPQTSFVQKIAALEKSSGGRLGVALINVHSGEKLAHRGDERFPFCSTFKAMLAAACLKRNEADATFLSRHIRFNKQDLITWSPITEKHVATGMTVAELCKATVQFSDNSAANLLIGELGGPAAVTEFARSMGDAVFSLDRWEPDLNTAEPGDIRDTTSPLAMAASVQQLAFGSTLQAESQNLFIDWLKGNTTGAESIRAGLPADWAVGDKTGSGAYGTTNDIAVIWPTKDKPFVLVVYFTQTDKNARPRKDILAQTARIAADSIRQQL